LKDYEGDTLLMAFPLQFPFGFGLPLPTSVESSKSNDNGTSKLGYLQHLQMLSSPAMHCGDFILVMHNMYEKNHAMTVAYLHCLQKDDDNSIAEQYANMTLKQIQTSIECAEYGLPILDNASCQFLCSVDATCKAMGHSNQAAKGA
jgi:hypothetical protein